MAVGNAMIVMGLFHHVCGDHLLENEFYFYRFEGGSADDGSQGQCFVLHIRTDWHILHWHFPTD
jgi:hypothetical protein